MICVCTYVVCVHTSYTYQNSKTSKQQVVHIEQAMDENQSGGYLFDQEKNIA